MRVLPLDRYRPLAEMQGLGRINAPPERVFDVLTDLQRIPEWHAGIGIKDVTGPPAVGAPPSR